MRGLISFLVIFLAVNTAAAQQMVRKVDGRLIFSGNLDTAGATLIWTSVNDTLTTLVNKSGSFSIELPLNRYYVSASLKDFRFIYLGEFIIAQYEPSFLSLKIKEHRLKHDTTYLTNQFTGHSLRFGHGEFNLLPGTLNDPGRVVNALPSVNTTHDQNNGASVRGNTPNYNRWRVQGVEIVNPNHQFNTGTFTDQTVWQGGSLNILQTDFIESSDFTYGLADAGYTNAISATYDIKLNQYYSQQTSQTIEAGMLGLKYGIKQPIGNAGAGFNLVYRGNPVGLAPFIDFGLLEDEVAYHDLNLSFSSPLFKTSTLTIFGIGGQHTRDFKGINEIADWERMKDRSDVNLMGTMAAVGGSVNMPLSKNIELDGAIAYSGRKEIRGEIQRDPTGFPGARADDDYTEKLLATSMSLSWDFNFGHLVTGLKHNQYDYQVQNTVQRILYRNLRSTVFDQEHQLTTAYADLELQIGNLNLAGGIQWNRQNLNNNTSLDPRIRFSYQLDAKNELFAGFGNYSQLMSPFIYYTLRNAEVTDGYLYPNKAFGMVRSEKAGMGWIHHFNSWTSIRAESYWQRFNNLPVSINSDFGVTDYLNGNAFYRLTPQGQSEIYGLELVVERAFRKGWYGLVGFNGMGSNYSTQNKENLKLRFDNGYSVKIHLGREFYQRRDRVFTAGIRAVWQGGMRSTRLELEQGPFLLVPRFKGDANSFQFNYYNRIDVRLKWLREMHNRSTAVILDIINVTNRDNVGFLFFDEVQQSIENNAQLGFMPVLTYQIKF